MNIAHLQLFIRIAATSNISIAGAELGISPAVASSHIKKLEENLGVRLIHRTTRKVSLTEEGNAFLRHAEDVISCVEAAKASVGAGSISPTGTIRVAAPASFGRMHLLPVIATFMNKNPNLKVDLNLSDTIVDLVEGGFDVAIRNSHLKDSSLVAKKLVNDKRILCASPDYVAKYGMPESPEDLKNHNCITLLNLDHWRFKKGKEVSTIKVSGNFRTDNGEAIRDACTCGIGITINSTWSAYKQIISGDLIEILPEHPLVSDTSIWVVYPSTQQLAPKVRAFVDYFSDYFSAQTYWDRQLEQREMR